MPSVSAGSLKAIKGNKVGSTISHSNKVNVPQNFWFYTFLYLLAHHRAAPGREESIQRWKWKEAGSWHIHNFNAFWIEVAWASSSSTSHFLGVHAYHSILTSSNTCWCVAGLWWPNLKNANCATVKKVFLNIINIQYYNIFGTFNCLNQYHLPAIIIICRIVDV